MPLYQVLRKVKAHNVSVGNFAVPLQCAAFGSKRRTKFYKTIRGAGETLLSSSLLHSSWGLKKIHVWYVPSPFSFGNLVGVHAKIQTLISQKMEFKHNICIFFTRVVIIAMLVISLSVTINKSPAYRAIKKMLSTLDDPFTRFLEPEKFKSLRSGTQGALTGVGLSIGYPLALNGSPTGLVVVSSAPGGPANKAGIGSGDIILAIDDESTEDMDIYDAAERLQGTEGSSVKLVIRSGTEIKDVVLSGGLFPEGIEIAKFWLDKGVIVYICDNRGVRDIYEADGSNTVAASEPLVVLVDLISLHI
ncbi:hypothetical protein B296_00020026 [Ensete ventricosum]|uniref:PDZ domain-containing protein n=1 Tax=Ensete ventricosum TaxID=4639 RepID=A0A427B1N9_ENSVE|nr:hypothetical protein B296_00020026 [Ensete ventricosum]